MGRKATKASSKKEKKKTQASESSQLKETIITEPTPAPTSSSNTPPPITTKYPSPTPSSSSKPPSPPPPKNAPLPKTPEADDSIIKDPVSSQGDQPKTTEEFFDTVGGKDEKEVNSEEDDLQSIGSEKKTSTPLVRSRVTRSSRKKIAEVILGEQPLDSAGTKRKRTATKSSRGMSIESPTIGMTDLGSRVVLSGCTTEVGYFDDVALSYVKDLLEYQGWMSLFDVCAANVDDVRKFYANLKQLLDRSLGSIVYNVEVNVSVASLAGLLNIPRDGFEEYSGEGWPTLIGVSPDDIYDFVFGGKAPKKAGILKTSSLKEPVMLVLHSLCNKMLIPRAQGRGVIRIMEMVLIYLLMKKIKINLPSLMLNHIMYSYNSSHHSLPYGSYITKLLQENTVSLSGSTVPVIVFTKGILKQKGLDICSGVLKFREEEPVETPKPAKKKQKAEEPASQKVLLTRMESQEEKISAVGDQLSKLMSLVEGLSTSFHVRMSKLENKVAGTSGDVKELVEEDQQADQQTGDNEEEDNQVDAAEEGDSEEEEKDDEDDNDD